MQRYRLILLSNPVEGREDEFNAWYDAHVDHLLEIPGFVSGQRFRQAESQRGPGPHPWKYLATYDIETEDLQGVFDELKSRTGTAALPGSSAIAEARIGCFYEPITELKTKRA